MPETGEQNLLSCRGKFTIALPVVMEMPDTVMKIMSEVLVLGCVCQFASHVFEYQGCCLQFEELEDGELIPTYDVEWDEEEQKATWTKQT